MITIGFAARPRALLLTLACVGSLLTACGTETKAAAPKPNGLVRKCVRLDKNPKAHAALERLLTHDMPKAEMIQAYKVPVDKDRREGSDVAIDFKGNPWTILATKITDPEGETATGLWALGATGIPMWPMNDAGRRNSWDHQTTTPMPPRAMLQRWRNLPETKAAEWCATNGDTVAAK